MASYRFTPGPDYGLDVYAGIAQVLDEAEIPSVLWGFGLMWTLGIPTVTWVSIVTISKLAWS